MTFDYPYHKAISVHSKNQGMEYLRFAGTTEDLKKMVPIATEQRCYDWCNYS